MLSQAIIHASRKNYYLELGKEDYYTEKSTVKGRWMGDGAKYFELEQEQIEKENRQLKNMMVGKDPSGEHELRRGGSTVKIYRDKETKEITKKSNPVCGYDNTFSAPKDVSLLWALSDQATQKTVLKIHQKAVKEATDYLESQVYTRSHSRNLDGTRTIEFHKAH